MSSFSDRLTPAQIQMILDSLNIQWRKYYNSENNGWVNVEHSDFSSDLSVNIFHGGWVDQYQNGHPDPETDRPIKGDIVTLVTWLVFESTDSKKGIEYIKDVCQIKDGISPPDVPEGFHFANDWLACEGARFARIPMEILSSDLSSTEKIIWCSLFSRCNKGEIYSFPGIRRIAKDTGLSKSTVQSATAKLADYGLIIEKFRDHNIPPARFPMVAPIENINHAINEKCRSIVSSEKSAVPNISTPLSAITDTPVPNISTELEPYNYNQYNKNQMHIVRSCRSGMLADDYFSLFRTVNKEFAIEYDRLLKEKRAIPLIDQICSN